MARLGSALLVAFLLGAASSSVAAPWSVGTNLDLTRRDEASGSTTTLGLPAGAMTFQPGLRLGFGPGDDRHELFLNDGFSTQSNRGMRIRALVSTVNYQHNLARGVETGPFFTVGAGIVDRRVTSGSGTVSSGTSG